jgi:tRNA(fMet)-specific endonuclease VapC
MTIQYLVDTDWAIHYLNDHEGIVQRLQELQRQEGLALSIISLAELYEGVYYSREPEDDDRALQDFLRGVTILGIDEHTCQIFGKERGRLHASGTMIGDCHLLIGATALRHDLTILTNNRRHFERIEGLRIESLWYKRPWGQVLHYPIAGQYSAIWRDHFV